MNADVLVVGGGPAGAAAALTLARHTQWRVVVVDRGEQTGPRVGESVGPAVLAQLRFLGAESAFAKGGHCRSWSTAAAWGSNEVVSRESILAAYGAGWQLDRAHFDASLLQQAEDSGAVVVRGLQVTGAERDVVSREWTLAATGAGAGATQVLRGRAVIDATGRGGALSRRVGCRGPRGDRLTAVVGFMSAAKGRDSVGVFVESVPDGWWYTAPLPSGGMVAAFFSDADLLRGARVTTTAGWIGALRRAPRTAQRTADRVPLTSLAVRPAQTRWCDALALGWLAAGDAAAAFDPLSGMGVGFALHTGILAARVADEELRDGTAMRAEYCRGLESTVRECRVRAAALYDVERRWPTPFWRRRQVTG